MTSVQHLIMEDLVDQEAVSLSGRVLVEPVEFVDLRDLARGNHGSHRASPEREVGVKKTSKAVSTSKDKTSNCLQITSQQRAMTRDLVCVNKVATEGAESDNRGPSKDEVLSVVIQKLTELVKSSEKESPVIRVPDDAEDAKRKTKAQTEDRTKLHQCPQCPCLFAVTQKYKKGQLCSCCSKGSRSCSPEVTPNQPEQTEQAYCYKDGQDHGGIPCDMCSVVVQSYNDLLYHLATHDVNIFRCKFCQFVTTRHAAIENHQEIHITEAAKKCVCNICGFRTNEFSKLQLHIKNDHQSITGILLKCSECGYSTKKESALRNHMWTHIKSDGALQSPRQQNSEARRQKLASPSQSDTEEAPKGGEGSMRRKGTKRPFVSSDFVDENTKLFKCLLCGYLCEKLSTLKAHAWRHAGQEGCSYPVVHKVEDLSEPTPSGDEDSKAADALKAEEFNFVELTGDGENAEGEKESTKKGAGCQCFPIILPEEEHQIVQQVFADATTIVETEDASGGISASKSPEVENLPIPSEECCNQLMPDQIENATANTAETATCCSVAQETVSCDVVTSESPATSIMEPFPLDVACTVVVKEEVVATRMAVEGNAQEAFVPGSARPSDSNDSSGPVEDLVKEKPVKEKPSKNLKRKRTDGEFMSEKRACDSPGISKMLLSAVDDALQTRAENEKNKRSGKSIDAKDDGVAKVITTSPKSPPDDHYQCPICKQVFPLDVQTHVCNQGSTPVFKCNKCPASFWHYWRLQAHMGTHEAILKCCKCSFSCISEMALRDHVKKTHLPAKSSICPSCLSEVVEKSPKSHEESCVLKCLYGCRECDFTANTMDELKSHCKDSHFKPYKCSACDYSSATPNGIKNHMKFHNTDKPYKCHLCEFSGAYPQSLRSHMKKHTATPAGPSNDTYKCRFCSYTSGHLPSMKSHMWKHSSHPGYDYDGQDIIKMVVRCDGSSTGLDEQVPSVEESKSVDDPQEQVLPVVNVEVASDKAPKKKSPGTPSRDSAKNSAPTIKVSAPTIKISAPVLVKASKEENIQQRELSKKSNKPASPALAEKTLQKRLADGSSKEAASTTKTTGPSTPDDPPNNNRQIQYGCVIFQCSQCGFKSNDHGCLVEHLKEHLKDTLKAQNYKV